MRKWVNGELQSSNNLIRRKDTLLGKLENRFLVIMKTENFRNILICALFIIALFLILIKLFIPFIGEDSGYYLKIASELSNGSDYYKLHCPYNPLGIYLLSFPFHFSTDMNLSLVYLYFFCIVILNAIVFMKILNLFKFEKTNILLSAGLFLVTLLLLDGTHILLETFVILFALAAIYYLYKYKFSIHFSYLVFSGAFAFLSFLSKQYGAFIIPASIVYLFFIRKNSKNLLVSLFSYCMGIIMAFLSSILYFHFIENTNLELLLARLIGLKIVGGNEIATGLGYSFSIAIHSFIDFITKYPFFLIIPILLIYTKKMKYRAEITMLIVTFIMSLIQFLFASYAHYFQLSVMPLLLIIPFLTDNSFANKNILKKLFHGLVTIFIIFGFYRTYNLFEFNKTNYFIQKNDCAVLAKKLKPGTKVYLKSVSQSFYFIAKLISVNKETYGYSFPNIYDINDVIKDSDRGSLFLVRNDFYENQLKNNARLEKIGELNLSNGIHCIISKK